MVFTLIKGLLLTIIITVILTTPWKYKNFKQYIKNLKIILLKEE